MSESQIAGKKSFRGWRRLIVVAAVVGFLALLLRSVMLLGATILITLTMSAVLYVVTGWVVAGFQAPRAGDLESKGYKGLQDGWPRVVLLAASLLLLALSARFAPSVASFMFYGSQAVASIYLVGGWVVEGFRTGQPERAESSSA